MPTTDEILAIQADCMADDVALVEGMTSWTSDEVQTFFESGGESKPVAVDVSDASPTPASTPASTTSPDAALAKFLSDNELASTAETLPADASFDGWLKVLNEDGRSGLIDHLKAAGVASPPVRQKLAKALATTARGSGMPVLVCFFSGGMTGAQGRDLMKHWLQKAKQELSLEDQVVCDHIGEPDSPFATTVWSEYVEACAAHVLNAAGDRPLIIVAHSHGCVGGYALARRLGLRVMKLCLICRRPPSHALLDEVLGVNDASKSAS
jgi:hypothetical protein